MTLIQRDGKCVSGLRVAGGVILPLLVVLNVEVDGRVRRSLVLPADSMDADSFRRLRVALGYRT